LISTLIRIIVSMRFHHLISEIRLFHAHDLIWLVVTNRSMRNARLESRFDTHIDINYCAHGNFTGRLNISPCFLSSYIFKLDDVMLVIWSCWWIQISVRGTLVSSHNLVPTLIQIIVCMRLSSNIAYSIIMHIVYVKYDA
jgi:hypothetical protein